MTFHPAAALLLFAGSACNGSKGDASEFGLDSRPSNPSCLAPDRPLGDAELRFERAFESLRFANPVALLQAPGDAEHWYVVEQAGRVRRFDDRPDASELHTFLNLRSEVRSGGELGLLDIAFHPEFADNGQVFVSYTAAGSVSRVSRFTSSDGGDTLDPASEQVLLSLAQPYDNHNGGDIDFGPDGLLYYSMGDGGLAGDPLSNGQDPSNLFGAISRIDVDGGSPYAIPPDNPFADGQGGAPEVYAYGLRNAWRMSFDTVTGELWAADVGQNRLEEVNRIVAGGNYGWNAKEGSDCYQGHPDCTDPSLIDPVAEYNHQQGRSITGGHVYRGSAIPALYGAYVYGDYTSGNVWAVLQNEDGEDEAQLVGNASGLEPSSFGQGHDGELLLVDYNGGLYDLLPVGEQSASPFPLLLSETGCMDPADPSLPGPSLVPYDVNMPLWSDGSDKQRWLAIPDGEQITVGSDGHWDLPIRSVLVKHFTLDERLIETRLLVRHEDGLWAGYTYQWDASGADARWVRFGAEVALSGGDTWQIPSSAECSMCHTSASGQTLGMETAQLARSLEYSPGRRGDQLDTLAHVGILDEAPETRSALPGLDQGADAARAYLHVQCAHCHRPDGTTGNEIDLRWTTPLEETGLCDALPEEVDLGIEDAVLLAPGEPARSLLLMRQRELGEHRMPPVGTAAVHAEGVEAVEQWITDLNGCGD